MMTPKVVTKTTEVAPMTTKTVGKNSDGGADDNDATKQTQQCQEEE